MLWFNVLEANVRKVAIELRRYLPNTLSLLFTFYAVFFGLFLGVQFLGSPEDAAQGTPYIIVNTVLWFLALMAMQGIGWEIEQEATRGTLEQLYMSPVGAWRILLARMIGTVLANALVIAVMLVLAMLTAQRWLTFDLLTLLPVLFFTILCMLGIGFMVAGLALIFKRIQAFLQIAQFIFLALVSVPPFVGWLELLPVIKGSDMIRRTMIEGTFLLQFSPFDWLSLISNAAVYFALGVSLYRLAEKRAMRLGLLGQY